jgi:hypothetical protein
MDGGVMSGFQTRIKGVRLFLLLCMVCPYLSFSSVAFADPETNSFTKDLSSAVPWSKATGTYTMEGDYVKLYNSSATQQNRAVKVIDVNQTVAEPILLRGESKALNVTVPAGYPWYSLRATVTYSDGKNEDFYTPFSTGTHDWELKVSTITPAKPIKTLVVSVMLYNATGTVWFRDVIVYGQGAAGTTPESPAITEPEPSEPVPAEGSDSGSSQPAAETGWTDVSSTVPWARSTGTYTMEGDYVKLYNSTATQQNRAVKTIALNQTEPKAILLRGESKALNVTVPAGYPWYSLRATLTYSDGKVENIYTPFTTGTHEWELKTNTITPTKPVKTLEVSVMLYNATGTAWFRNVMAYEQSAAGEANPESPVVTEPEPSEPPTEPTPAEEPDSAGSQPAAETGWTDVSSAVSWARSTGTYTMEGDYVKLYNSSATQQNRAVKTIALNQTEPKAILLRGESKALNVTVPAGYPWYSLRATLTYSDGKVENIYTPFTTGTHDWELKARTITPTKPVKTLVVSVMLYNATGTAWFRNVFAYEETVPGSGTEEPPPSSGSGSTGSPEATNPDESGSEETQEPPPTSGGTTQDPVAPGGVGSAGWQLVSSATDGGGYQVKDQTANSAWISLSNGSTSNGWNLSTTVQVKGTFNYHSATLTNTYKTTRAGSLKYRIPIPKTGLRWCNIDLKTQTAVSGTNLYKNEISNYFQGLLGNYQPKPDHIWGSVVNNTTGYAIAIDPLAPAQFRIHYDAGSGELYILYDLGFAPSVANATVRFTTWTFNPQQGARQVVKDVYDLYPAAFKDRITARGGTHGLWAIKDFSSSNISNFSDFGIKYNQSNSPQASIDFDRKNGIHTMKYLRPTESFISMAGVATPYSESSVLSRLNTLISQGDGDALSIRNSGIRDPQGRYLFWWGSGWSSGIARFVVNSAPRITPSPNNFERQWNSSGIQDSFNKLGMQGAVVDNSEYFYWMSVQADRVTRLDFYQPHFAQMTTPLTFDTQKRVGIGYEMMQYEYLKGVRDDVSSRAELIPILGNGVPYNTTLIASQFDLIGGETSWQKANNVWSPPSEERLLKFRIQAGKKPVVFLQNPYSFPDWTNSMTQKYFARSALIGALPSFFLDGGGATNVGTRYFNVPSYLERDRATFKKYIPVIKTISEAGWEPIRNASASDSSIMIERFGDIAGGNKTVYLSVFNPTTSTKTFTLTSTAFSSGVVEFKDLITNTNKTWSGSSISLTLAGEAVAVLKIRLN